MYCGNQSNRTVIKANTKRMSRSDSVGSTLSARQEAEAVLAVHRDKMTEGEQWAIVDQKWLDTWINYTGNYDLALLKMTSPNRYFELTNVVSVCLSLS
jgi:hypothetical protein